MSKTDAGWHGCGRGLRALAVTVLLGGGAAGAAAQELVNGGGLLSCGGLHFLAVDPAPGPPVSVADGTQVSVLDLPVEMRCAGPVAATFTAELSGFPSSVALVTIVAQCLDAPPGPEACTPSESLSLVPRAYRIPLALAAGPEARTVAAGALLPAGRYGVNVLVGAQGGEVAVEKATLVIVTGGTFPGSSARGGGLPPARPAGSGGLEGAP